MSAYKFPALLLLLFALTLAQACKPSRGQKGAANTGRTDAPSNAAGRRAGTELNDYYDTDGDFSIKLPDGCAVEREEQDGAYMTVIRPARQRPANISILTIKAVLPKTDSADLQSHMLVDSSEPFFRGWFNGLVEQARVEDRSDVYPTQFANLNAMRLDVTYYRDDDDDPRRGYAVYLIGDKTACFITLTAGRSQFKELEEILSTIRIEP
ncbi:MAG: hypothetical protein ACJ74Q_26275 [Pyrinomonadaceae bacterium]